MTLGGFAITSLRNEFLSSSLVYIFSPLIFMIPDRAKYTSFEKLAKPFQVNVWIPLTVCSIVVVLLIKFYPDKFKELRIKALGDTNQDSMLNMCSVIVGSSVLLLPVKNLSRFLWTFFVLFFLVLRTVYQAGLFTNMQSDILKNPMASIAEMIEKDFYFYIAPNILVFSIGSIIDKRFE